jgi:hypothetical protein
MLLFFLPLVFVQYSDALGSSIQLFNGTVVSILSLDMYEIISYYIVIPPNVSSLQVQTSGGAGDVDLYLRYGAPPTTANYDYRSYSSTNTESIFVANPSEGNWYFSVNGYDSSSGVNLKVEFSLVNPPIPSSFNWNLFLPAIVRKKSISVDNAETVIWGNKEWQRGDSGKEICNVGDDYGHCATDAVAYCSNLVLGGHSDWRLPTRDELKSLVVCSNGKPTPLQDIYLADEETWPGTCSTYQGDSNFVSPTIDSRFKNTGNYYWSATKDTSWPPVTSPHYWMTSFSDGRTTGMSYDYEFYVRCIRD